MNVDRQKAVEVAATAFMGHGITEASAYLTSEVLVSADARDKHSHGLLRLPRFIRGIEHGHVDPDGEITIVTEHRGVATLSGGSRLGPVVASKAIAEAIDRADEYGIGAVGVHDSNHLGMLGYYTDTLRESGYIGVAMTNTEPAMPPYGGTEPVLGTNPIAIGLPTDPAFNLDMSTSAIARGTVEQKKEAGDSLPDDVALDTDGNRTTDPTAALEGTILPFGGPKGSGLAVAIELLAGTLVGAATGTDVTGTYHTEEPCTKGDLFVAIDPAAMDVPEFTERASTFLDDLKASEKSSGVDEIRLPGEHSVRLGRTRTAIEIDDDLWHRVLDLADGE